MKTTSLFIALFCSVLIYGQTEEVIINYSSTNETTEQPKTEEPKKEKRDVQTLFNPGKLTGFNGGPIWKSGVLNDQMSFWSGGYLVIGIDHKLNIGGAGYGLISNVNSNYVDYNGNGGYVFEMAYGGVLIEPVLWDDKLVHATIPILLGGGAASVSNVRVYDLGWNGYNDATAFYVAEPGINMELNVFRHLRLGLGGSYRLVSGSSLINTTDFDLSGFNGNLSLKFGWF